VSLHNARADGLPPQLAADGYDLRRLRHQNL
jgi:hypothetical protein